MWNLAKHINKFIPVSRRRPEYEQLQWQRNLLRTGIPATVQVLDLVQEKSSMNEYVQVHFWAMLQLQGTVTYRHLHTLELKRNIPAIGQTIHIKYCPDDMSKVIIV